MCCDKPAAVSPALADLGGLVAEEQGPADDRLRLAPLRNAIMVDSGAQISAVPRSQVSEHNYTTTDSNVVG